MAGEQTGKTEQHPQDPSTAPRSCGEPAQQQQLVTAAAPRAREHSAGAHAAVPPLHPELYIGRGIHITEESMYGCAVMRNQKGMDMFGGTGSLQVRGSAGLGAAVATTA